MRKNVIILTVGLAGSSVLAAMLSQAGYWVGEETFKKEGDYNTWENLELVRLNKQIIEAVGFKEDWTMEFEPDYISRMEQGFNALDPEPYRAFVAHCNQHQPWIWKDPRLWLTMRYWQRFLETDKLFFLVIRREHTQAWISTTLRRQIQSMGYLKRYSDGINGTILDFLTGQGLAHTVVQYEELLMQPEAVIKRINQGAGTALTFDNFKAIFHGRLHRKQHGLKSFLKASAIYLKNYGERYRLVDGRPVRPK